MLSTAALLIAILPALYWLYARNTSAKIPLPPSPPGDPVVGHVRFMPQKYAWITFAGWTKKFGELNLIVGHIISY